MGLYVLQHSSASPPQDFHTLQVRALALVHTRLQLALIQSIQNALT